MKLGMGGSTWGEHRNSDSGSGRIDPSDEDYEKVKKLQFTVASSTFGGIAFIGLFCTCLWLSCCKQKRTSRIRGRTWHQNNSFAIQNGTTLANPYLHRDPRGLNMNPYMITPNYYSDANLTTANGLYHPSIAGGFGFTEDVKPPADAEDPLNQNTNNANSYRPFFKKPEWDPPAPPSYDTLGFVNPGYETNSANADMDDKGQIKKELITEKVLSSILATCDPSKRVNVKGAGDSKEGTDPEGNKCQGQKAGENDTAKSSTSTSERSSAPPESIVSIESKDGGQPYPEGHKIPQRPEGHLEELAPPPFNPSYLFN